MKKESPIIDIKMKLDKKYNRQIGFYPKSLNRRENAYFSAITEIIDSLGYEIVEFPKALVCPSIRIVSLNFFENIIADNWLVALLKFLKRIGILMALGFMRKKIIFTLHNRMPHDTKYSFLSRIIILLLLRRATVIIGLCEETKTVINQYTNNNSNIIKKIVIIPHPSYRVISTFSKNSSRCMKVLFVGQIRRYKNVELIIKLAKDYSEMNIEFCISGMVSDIEYKKELENEVGRANNIRMEYAFLSEDELQKRIAECDIVILPYDKRSALNSGLLYLAFSLGTTCICPDIGSARDVTNKQAFYMYEYTNQTDHYDRLKEAFEEAWKDFRKGNLANKGLECIREVELYNSWSVVKEEYNKMLGCISG